MSLAAALVLLGIARLLPEHGFGLWVRLAAATLVLLAPGRLVARALGQRSWAAAFAWSVAVVAAALAVTLAVHASLTLTLVLVLVVGGGAWLAQRHRRSGSGARLAQRHRRLGSGAWLAQRRRRFGSGAWLAQRAWHRFTKGDATMPVPGSRSVPGTASLEKSGAWLAQRHRRSGSGAWLAQRAWHRFTKGDATMPVPGSRSVPGTASLEKSGARHPLRGSQAPGGLAVALAGIGLGIALWSLEGLVKGDALFHLGRIRKLDDFGSLSLRAVDEFRDGGLHPGYAFPLWHGWLALVAKLGGVDPTSVVLHESSILTPLALVLAFELGMRVFGSAALAAGVAAAQVGMIALAPGGGGAYTSLELPGTTARQLLVPAVVALFFVFVREPSWRAALTLAAASMGLAFVHPTYALFVGIPLLGYALVRARDVRVDATALASFGIPVVLVFLWLLPLVRETSSHNPDAVEKARAIQTYASDLVVHSPTRYHLAAFLVDRTGAIAIAALVLVPLAAFAARRRWSAFVLGGTALLLALELSTYVFPRFSDLVSLSQSRRAAGFVPFAVALAGGAAVLSRALRWLVLPVALAAGIVLELEYPGDFGKRLAHGGPSIATWIALFGGLTGSLVAVLWRRRYERADWVAAAAALLFVAPVAVHGFANWDAAPRTDAYALTPGLVQFLRRHVPERSVVYGDLETSYRISAYVPVYVANAPPTHVADTTVNDPYGRRDALRRYLRTGSLAIPKRYGAEWIVLRPHEPIQTGARLVYRDDRFRVFRP